MNKAEWIEQRRAMENRVKENDNNQRQPNDCRCFACRQQNIDADRDNKKRPQITDRRKQIVNRENIQSEQIKYPQNTEEYDKRTDDDFRFALQFGIVRFNDS